MSGVYRALDTWAEFLLAKRNDAMAPGLDYACSRYCT